MDEDIFYHEMPIYWAVPEFIPDRLRSRLSPSELLRLEQDILAAFRDEQHYYFQPETDFSVYQSALDAVLAQYGESLDSL